MKTWDKDYFSPPTVSNSYWAGLLAADGNIAHTKGQSRISISLSATDRQTLVSLTDEIHYDGQLQEYSTQNNSNMVRLGLILRLFV